METMTLEQMYYIVEIIGVDVIALLLYVNKQLQQNTEHMDSIWLVQNYPRVNDVKTIWNKNVLLQ